MTFGRHRQVSLLILLCLTSLLVSGAIGAARAEAVGAVHPTPRIAGGGEFGLLIKPDGSLWSWGYDLHGQLGVGDLTLRPVAWRVGTTNDWATVACGDYHSLAIKTDGTLWAWGLNASGELGLGDTTDRTSPVQVGTTAGWATMACGDAYSMAIKTDGSLWAWGANASGQLGLGDLVTRTSPTRVGTATDWAAVSCGAQFTLALKTDGTLWAWGNNSRGQLGLGDAVTRLSPVAVGTDTDWTTIGCGDADAHALKGNGTLWSWGYNDYGQLGQGDTVARKVPTRVGQDADWASLARGDDHVVAIKTDGSLWTCGDDTYGQLGQGDTTARSLLTRVGSGTDWVSVACADDTTMALKQDGSLWVSGHNSCGELSLADFVSRSSPTFAFFIGDTTAPAVASLASPTHPDPATWYSNSNPTFTWSAADVSGVGGFRYLFDQTAGTQVPIAYPHFETTISYTGKADGIWYLHIRALDRGGNWGATSTLQVRIDTKAPVTTQSGADSAWHTGPVTVKFKASDSLSGVALTQYQLDGGAWTSGTALTVSAVGAHTVAYRSRDKAGNIETAKTCQVNIGTSFTVTATAGANGTISPSGAQAIAAGSSQSFAITPDAGYHVADVVVDGLSVGAVTSYAFTSLSADHTIAASFAADAVVTYTITASAGTNGTISPSGAQTLSAGATPSFTITPDAGYHVADVLVDGISVGAVTSYTFTALSADHTIAASFAVDTFTVTATAGSNGTISPSGAQTIAAGSTPSFAITPATGYHVADVAVDGLSVGAVTSYAFTALSADHTIAASFAIDTFTVTASAGVNGTISPSGAQTLSAGSTPSFTITPNAGYHVADVVVDGLSVGAVTSYTFTALSADHTIAASFAADPATATVTWPNGGESMPAGIPVTVTWTSPQLTSGVFTIWAVSQAGTNYGLGTVNADGSASYGKIWNVSVPAGSYRIRVSYGPTTGTYTTTDYSDGYFTVSPGATVTAPNGGESMPAGIPVTVTWTSPSVSYGVFTVWALSQAGTYYNIGTVNANGTGAYSTSWNVNAPPGSYRLRVSYSPTTGTNYTTTDYSDAYFTVTPGATVTWPNGGESLPTAVPITVTWTSPSVSYGVFTVWALSQAGTYYNIGTINANGSLSYGKTWSVKAPAGSYRIRVSYGVTTGTSYTITDYSDGYFTVTTS